MKNILYLFVFIIASCSEPTPQTVKNEKIEPLNKIPVLIDTDANNELDDQHALAYLFFNGDVFDVKGVTVNATKSGGNIDEHYAEAERIMKLCQVDDKIPLLNGANGNFDTLITQVGNPAYDGKAAVDFIIAEARKRQDDPLILLPVGKLTNIALALEAAPDIKDKVRIVWLGSNYPEPGEYNQENDTASLSYILEQNVAFEMVIVRYGKPSGSDAVRATPEDIAAKMPKAGPKVAPVEGRNGGTFTNFGDYSIDLFQNIELHGDPPSRALFDMVAVAILKEPDWGTQRVIPAPRLVEGSWQEQSANNRKITLWENFDKDAIMLDFYKSMRVPVLVETPK